MKAAKQPTPDMAELRLGKRYTTGYGNRYEGIVATEDNDISITWREPPTHKQTGKIYVLATGWLGRKDSMRGPAHEVVEADHIVVAFNYTNRQPTGALERNAADFAAVIDSLPAELKRYVIALSMSGAILADALVQTTTRVEAGTAVAPAGYIRGPHSLREAAQHLGATIPELVGLSGKDPVKAANLGVTTLLHYTSRRQAIEAEFNELRQDRDPSNLYAVMSAPNPPFMRFLYGSNDLLFPAEAQAEVAGELPFNHVEMYQGGHLALIHNVELPRHILDLDSQLAVRPPLGLAA